MSSSGNTIAHGVIAHGVTAHGVTTAGIVGLNWGLVHLRGLREAGCEVVVLAALDEDRAREVALREHVPHATSDIGSLNALDLVVVAAPADSHAAVLQQLPDPRIICEKPLLGLRTPLADLPPTGGRMFVNYAFGFLNTARVAASVVRRLGDPLRVELHVGVGLTHQFSAGQWFLETAGHPLSWLLGLFGPPSVTRRQIGSDGVDVQLVAGTTEVAAHLRLGGPDGIRQRLDFAWPGHAMVIAGGFQPGGGWRYEPVMLDGSSLNDGEWSPSDCWLDANAASVRAMVSAFRGEVRASEALFDADRALWLERVIRADLSG